MTVHLLFETLAWALLASLGLMIILGAAQGLRLTRINLPIILGTMVSGNLDRANRLGYLLHFVAGLLQGFVYLLIFWAVGAATWYAGLLLGLVHGLFILVVALPLTPSIHPRMASEHRQPRPTALLEPPGFLGMYYGAGTPVATLVAHAVYGTVLGAGLPV